MGTKRQDIIEINGKRYDALTGRLVEDEPKVIAPTKTAAPLPKSAVSMDGFKRRKKQTTPHQQASHSKKAQQKSQTLMRGGVKKPHTAQSSIPHTAQNQSKIGPSPRLSAMAQKVKLHPLVTHFGANQHQSSVVKTIAADLPVAPQQVVTKTRGQAVAALPHHQQVAAAAGTANSSKKQQMIEHALAHATAHEQPSHAKHRAAHRRHKLAKKLGVSARVMSVSSLLLALVLLAGFFATQNVPNLSMRVAAARAGFDANMPAYKPAGFSFRGPINYNAGQVSISFRSNTDDRTYTVTERESAWNSDALLANFVATGERQYQTYVDRGRTLYIYDGANATWVDNGIWYQIEGPSRMSTDQLIRIASSI